MDVRREIARRAIERKRGPVLSEYFKPSIPGIRKPVVLQNNKEMTPFIGTGLSIIGSAIGGIFSPEGKARRQQRRLERRTKRAARKAGKIAVKQPAVKVPYYPPTPKIEPSVAEIKAVGGKVPIGNWLRENWYFVAGGAAVLLLVVFMATKKKKVVRRRKKSNPSSSSSKSNPGSSRKSSGSFATRTRRVNLAWKKAKAGGSKIGRKAAWAKWG
ncbi:hypothetical protein ES705_25033 [subsurface metagenome]